MPILPQLLLATLPRHLSSLLHHLQVLVISVVGRLPLHSLSSIHLSIIVLISKNTPLRKILLPNIQVTKALSLPKVQPKLSLCSCKAGHSNLSVFLLVETQIPETTGTDTREGQDLDTHRHSHHRHCTNPPPGACHLLHPLPAAPLGNTAWVSILLYLYIA